MKMTSILRRQRWAGFACLLALFVVTLSVVATLTQASERPPSAAEQAAAHPGRATYTLRRPHMEGVAPECKGPNLLQNPSFEGEYSAWEPPDGHPDCPAGICTTAQMAEHWTPYWRSHDPDDPPWIIVNPEYKPAESVFVNPPRVRSGDRAQQYFSFFTTHEAGFYQSAPVEPGSEYCFSIWGHSWSAGDDDDAFTGPEDGIMQQRVGIDLTGNTDWESGTIQWGEMLVVPDFYDAFLLRGVAQSDLMTVFAYSQPMWAVKHNDVYWDDARLVKVALDPVRSVVFLEETGEQGFTELLWPINLSGPADLAWTAEIQPGANIPGLSLSRLTGSAGQNTRMSIDSTGAAPGAYHATIIVTASEAVAGSPATINVVLTITDEIKGLHLPTITHP